MRVLIIGATGRIGRFAPLRALDAGHDVRALVRDTEDADVPEGVAVRGRRLARSGRGHERADRRRRGHLGGRCASDAVYVAGGEKAATWAMESDAVDFIRDAYKHAKAVAATGEGLSLLAAAQIPIGDADSPDPADAATIVARKMTRAVGDRFVEAMRRHRLWTRELEVHLPFEA